MSESADRVIPDFPADHVSSGGGTNSRRESATSRDGDDQDSIFSHSTTSSGSSFLSDISGIGFPRMSGGSSSGNAVGSSYWQSRYGQEPVKQTSLSSGAHSPGSGSFLCGTRSAISTAPTSPRQSISSRSSFGLPKPTATEASVDKGKAREIVPPLPSITTLPSQRRPDSTRHLSSPSSSTLANSDSSSATVQQGAFARDGLPSTELEARSSADWWDSVLGPNQLAERRKKSQAQRVPPVSSSNGPGSVTAESSTSSRPSRSRSIVSPAPEDYMDTSGTFVREKLHRSTSQQRGIPSSPAGSQSASSPSMSSIARTRSAGAAVGQRKSNARLSAEIQAASNSMQKILDSAPRPSSILSNGSSGGSSQSNGLGIATGSKLFDGPDRATEAAPASNAWHVGEFSPPTASDIRRNARSAQQHLAAKGVNQARLEQQERESRRAAKQAAAARAKAEAQAKAAAAAAKAEAQAQASASEEGTATPKETKLMSQPPRPSLASVQQDPVDKGLLPSPDDTADAFAIAAAHFKRSFSNRTMQPLLEDTVLLSPNAAHSRFERHTTGRRSRIVSEEGFLSPNSDDGSRSPQLVQSEKSSGEEDGDYRQFLARFPSQVEPSHSTTTRTTSRTTTRRRTLSTLSSTNSSIYLDPIGQRSRTNSTSQTRTNSDDSDTEVIQEDTGSHAAYGGDHRSRASSLYGDESAAYLDDNATPPLQQEHRYHRDAKSFSGASRPRRPMAGFMSMPGSRRTSIHSDMDRSPFYSFDKNQSVESFAFGTHEGQSQVKHHRASTVVSDLAALRSLDAAHHQLSNAGHLAKTLTRQISTPLKPILQFWLAASISSVALISLVTFMILSYVLTAWDDVGTRGRSVGVAADQARKNLEASVNWGRKMLHFTPVPEGSPSGQAGSSWEREGGSPSGSHHRSTFGSIFAKVAPTRFFSEDENSSGAGREQPRRKAPSPSVPPPVSDDDEPEFWDQQPRYRDERSKAAPPRPTAGFGPRPPLRMLIPGIFFTLLLAFSASMLTVVTNYRVQKREEQEKLKRSQQESDDYPVERDSPPLQSTNSRRRQRYERMSEAYM